MNNYFRRKLRGIRASHNGAPKDTAEAINTNTLTFNSTSNKNLIDLQIFGNTEMYTNGVLPIGYTQLEYLESSGTQYINTGVVPFDNIGFGVTFYSLSEMTSAGSTTYGCIFGSRVSSNSKEIQLTTWSGVLAQQGCIAYGDTARKAAGITKLTKQTAMLQNLQYTSPNPTYNYTFPSFTWSESGNTYPIFLFGLNHAGTFTQGGLGCRIYDFIIYNGSTVAYHFIPAKRNSDSVLGMYDIVNNVFKTNAGTGTFTAGAECPCPAIPSIIQSVGDKTENLLEMFKRTQGFASGGSSTKRPDLAVDKYYLGLTSSNIAGSPSAYVTTFDADNAEVTFVPNNAQSKCIGFPLKLKSGTTYTIQAALRSDPAVSNINIVVMYYSADGTFLGSNASMDTKNGTITFSFTTNAESVTTFINFQRGSSANDTKAIIKNAILVEGTYTAQTMPSYEPYGYKIPISVSGKNLLNGTVVRNDYTTNKTHLMPGTYMFSFDVSNATKWRYDIIVTDENGEKIPSALYNARPTTYITGSNAHKIAADTTSTTIRFSLSRQADVTFTITGGDTTASTTVTNAQIEIGNERTAYEPYQMPSAYTVYLDEPLRKNGDNVDYISLKDGKVYRNNAKYSYKGDESILLFDNNKGFRYTVGNQKEGSALDGFCNRYKNYKSVGNATASQRVIFGASDSDTQMYIRKFNTDGSDTTVEDMQTALTGWYNGGNPLSVVYPTEIQTAQTISFPSIATVQGTNIIKIGTAETPSKIKAVFYE